MRSLVDCRLGGRAGLLILPLLGVAGAEDDVVIISGAASSAMAYGTWFLPGSCHKQAKPWRRGEFASAGYL